jgi:hypothetical protein
MPEFLLNYIEYFKEQYVYKKIYTKTVKSTKSELNINDKAFDKFHELIS